MGYPVTLTTSDWADFLEGCPTREDTIAALATWHRRIDYDARQSVLANVAAPEGVIVAVLEPTVKALAAAIPVPVDYTPAEADDAQAFVAVGAVAVLAIKATPMPLPTLEIPSV